MLLELQDLSCQRGDGRSGIRLSVPSLTLDRGEALAVTGPSGCGKSTLLDIVGLVLRPAEAGRFRFAGGDMAAWWAGGHHDRLARARAIGIGYVLQTGGLLPFATVRDNIRLSPALLGLAPDDAKERHLVETLGIGHLLDKKPAQLSIGERQRVAIARALAHRPPLILADEPTASLDPVNATAVIELLMGLVSEMKLSLVVVSHDWSILERFRPRRLDARIEAGAGGTVTRFAA